MVKGNTIAASCNKGAGSKVSRRNYNGTKTKQLEVLNTVSQSLAGRMALLKLLPFSIRELGQLDEPSSVDRLPLTGFYPRIYDHKLDPTQALE